jgi:hypothetical protein
LLGRHPSKAERHHQAPAKAAAGPVQSIRQANNAARGNAAIKSKPGTAFKREMPVEIADA